MHERQNAVADDGYVGEKSQWQHMYTPAIPKAHAGSHELHDLVYIADNRMLTFEDNVGPEIHLKILSMAMRPGYRTQSQQHVLRVQHVVHEKRVLPFVVQIDEHGRDEIGLHLADGVDE